MTSTFSVVVQYRTKPGTTDDVLKHLHNMATETRKEPGNISYEFFRGVEDDRKITILESYRSEEDFELHRQTPHCLDLGPAHIIPQLESRTLATYVTADSPAETQ